MTDTVRKGPDMPESVAGRQPTRRQLAAQQTRQRLLQAALENFSRRPYAEVTVGSIARSAGVSHGLLSHHFNGKESLYAEAVREVDRRLRAATVIAPDGTVRERLRRHFADHLRFLADHEEAARNLILRRAAPTDLAWEAFEATRSEGEHAICELLGLDLAEPATQLAMGSFGAACDEMARCWLRKGRPFEIDALAEAWITLLAASVRTAHELAPHPSLTEALGMLSPAPSRKKQ